MASTRAKKEANKLAGIREEEVIAPRGEDGKLSAKLRKLSSGGTGGRSNIERGEAWTSLLDSKPTRSKVNLELSATSESGSSPSEEELEEDEPPQAVRGLVEVDKLSMLIGNNLKCGKCNRKAVGMNFKSIGVHTIPSIVCSNCGFECFSEHTGTGFSPGKHAKQTDYATNVLYVMAGIASGDGGTEAEKLCGFLGLPNYLSMQRTTFSNVEKQLEDHYESVTKAAVEDSLKMEVRAATETIPDFGFDKWWEAVMNKTFLDQKDYPRISITFDGGWQKRSSGRRYDSLSGHAFPCGALCGNPIGIALKSKFCRICARFTALGVSPIPEHAKCTKNHTGSSISMEADSLLDMIHWLFYSYKIAVEKVITDDDSTMASRAQWSIPDWMKHNNIIEWPRVSTGNQGKTMRKKSTGVLDYPIPPPEFGANPAHRKKTLKKRLYAFNKKKRRKGSDLTKVISSVSRRTSPLWCISCQPWLILENGRRRGWQS